MSKQAITYLDLKTGTKTTSLFPYTLSKSIKKSESQIQIWIERAKNQGGVLTTKKFMLILSDFAKHGNANDGNDGED